MTPSGLQAPLKPWKPKPGLTHRERKAEQDTAAGGRKNRAIHLQGSRIATGSIELKQISSAYSVYAYLRFTDGARTVVRYLGRVPDHSRHAALREAWRIARAKKLVSPPR